jgi:hypothetical protein
MRREWMALLRTQTVTITILPVVSIAEPPRKCLSLVGFLEKEKK